MQGYFATVSSSVPRSRPVGVRELDGDENDEPQVDETKLHCPIGADCSSIFCLKMHPCPGKNGCRHSGKVWLGFDAYKRNKNKRFKTCLKNAQAKKVSNDKKSAIEKQRRRQKRELHEVSEHPA